MAPYVRDAVLDAAQEVADVASYAAWRYAAYAGDVIRNEAKIRAQTVAANALPSIEAAAQAAAVSGATVIGQTAEATSVGYIAQASAAATDQAAVLAGTLDQVFGGAQSDASDAAAFIADGYADRAATEARALIAAQEFDAVVAKGRSALCNPSTVSSPGVSIPTSKPSTFGGLGAAFSFRFAPNQVMTVDRSQAQFTLEVDGNNVNSTYQPYVEDIIVDETCDHAVSMLKINILNDNNRFGDDNIWAQHKKIRLWMGYQMTGVMRRGNLFYSMGPRITYPEHGGTSMIQITAYGEEMRLGRTQKRKTWTNITDANIAAAIAGDYGWGVDADATDPLHEHVAQMNESDWKFLDRRARYYGYQVYVDNGVLHFHAPRYEPSGIRLVYRDGQNSQLNGFTSWQETLQYGKEVQADQIDPLSKEIFTVISQDTDDDVSKKTKAAYKDGTTITSTQMASLDGDQPKLFMFEEGHKQTRGSLGTEVEGFSQSTRWLVGGEGGVVGLENLRVRNIIELIGIGRDSGEYYIRQLSTTIKAGQFLTRFKVARTWRGGYRGARVGSKKVEPQRDAN